MKKSLLWILVVFLALGAVSAQAQSALPQAADWRDPEAFVRYFSYTVDETTGKWSVRAPEADALLDRFWTDGADYDGQLCVFWPEIEGYLQNGVWMPVLRLYWMQDSHDINARAVMLRVDGELYALAAHTAIVENGRHSAEVVSAPLGEHAGQILAALASGEEIALRLIGDEIYTQTLDWESTRERVEIARASRDAIVASAALLEQAGIDTYALWDLSNAAWEAEYGYCPMLETGSITSPIVLEEDVLLEDDFGIICPGDRGDAATAAQEALIAAGFLSGDPASSFDGEASAAALRAQRYWGRLETGCVDLALIRTLRGENVPAEETVSTAQEEPAALGEIAEIALSRYWFAQAYHPTAAPAAARAAANSDNVFFLADGWIRNLSGEELRLFTDLTVDVYCGETAFPATLSCERDGQTQFDSALIPLAQCRLVVSAEIPQALALEENAQWQIVFAAGEDTLVYPVE